jgi:hypothetical protein
MYDEGVLGAVMLKGSPANITGMYASRKNSQIAIRQIQIVLPFCLKSQNPREDNPAVAGKRKTKYDVKGESVFPGELAEPPAPESPINR